MREYLLPNIYKKIALSTAIIAFIAFILKYPLSDLIPLEQVRVEWILKDLILISLLFLVFSKEKNESEEIRQLRTQELKAAIIFGGIILLWQSIQEIIFWDDHYEIESGYAIMVSMLLFYLVFFTYKKYSQKNKNG